MQNYTLSEQDIKGLIGAAGNAVCEDEIFPREFDGMIMKVSAEIAMKLLDHLSCENTFPKEIIEMIENLFGIVGGDQSGGKNHGISGV